MSVWPAWEVLEGGEAMSWFTVRLAFPDGAGVEALAVLREGSVLLEDGRAQPALSPDDLAVLADRIEGPLLDACGLDTEEPGEPPAARRARPGRPRGREGRRLVAEEYRAAQEGASTPSSR